MNPGWWLDGHSAPPICLVSHVISHGLFIPQGILLLPLFPPLLYSSLSHYFAGPGSTEVTMTWKGGNGSKSLSGDRMPSGLMTKDYNSARKRRLTYQRGHYLSNSHPLLALTATLTFPFQILYHSLQVPWYKDWKISAIVARRAASPETQTMLPRLIVHTQSIPNSARAAKFSTLFPHFQLSRKSALGSGRASQLSFLILTYSENGQIRNINPHPHSVSPLSQLRSHLPGCIQTSTHTTHAGINCTANLQCSGFFWFF